MRKIKQMVKKRKIPGRLAEAKSANRMDMRLTPGSGNQVHSKGDFKNVDYLVEHKSTVNKSISLKASWWVKIRGEAQNELKTPALMLTFVDHNGEPSQGIRGGLVLISEREFKRLCSLQE